MSLGDAGCQRFIEKTPLAKLDGPRFAHAAVVGAAWSGFCSVQVHSGEFDSCLSSFSVFLFDSFFCLSVCSACSCRRLHEPLSLVCFVASFFLDIVNLPPCQIYHLAERLVGPGTDLRAVGLKMLITTAVLSTAGNYVNMSARQLLGGGYRDPEAVFRNVNARIAEVQYIAEHAHAKGAAATAACKPLYASVWDGTDVHRERLRGLQTLPPVGLYDSCVTNEAMLFFCWFMYLPLFSFVFCSHKGGGGGLESVAALRRGVLQVRAAARARHHHHRCELPVGLLHLLHGEPARQHCGRPLRIHR
jgi:hypothetical protein